MNLQEQYEAARNDEVFQEICYELMQASKRKERVGYLLDKRDDYLKEHYPLVYEDNVNKTTL